jgi:hypothetical protein
MAVSILALHRHYYINQERAICSFDSCKKQMDATKDKVMRCAGCKVAPYCSKECQAGDWKRHKQICQLLKAPFSLEGSPFTALFSSSSIKRSFPNPHFDSSKVYIVTNEANHAEVIESLAKQPAFGNTLVGVSALANLNMAAVRESVSNVLIIDPSSKVRLFMENFSLIIKAYETKESCLQALRAHIATYLNPDYTTPFSIESGRVKRDVEWYNSKLDAQESFFSSDLKFCKIRNLFLEHKVAFLEGDFSDSSLVSEVAKRFNELKLTLDTLYLSNILDLMTQDRMGDFAKNLQLLISGECLVVDTFEKPFKTTKYLSKALKDDVLDRFVYSSTFSEKTGSGLKTTQRVRGVDQSFLDSFPILNFRLTTRASNDRFFYEYGLYSKFFTEIESEKAEKIALDLFKEIKQKQSYSNADLLEKFERFSLEAFNSLK